LNQLVVKFTFLENYGGLQEVSSGGLHCLWYVTDKWCVKILYHKNNMICVEITGKTTKNGLILNCNGVLIHGPVFLMPNYEEFELVNMAL
jgi:hypothetical protein